MKRLVLLAVACATAVVLWVAAAGAAQNGSGGPLAKSAAVTTRHIPLSRASGVMPRALKGVPAKGSYAFLLELKAEPTGVAYNAFRNLGKSQAHTAAVNELATVKAAQNSVIAALPSGSHVLYKTHAALAGVAVYTKVANVPALQRISGVAKVYPIAPKRPSLSYAVHLQKAPEAWHAGPAGSSLGEHSTVAIIDTGIDYTHADFGGSGNPADYQTALANDTVAPTPGTFDPTKFVGGNVGRDFAGDAYNADDPQHSTPAPDPNPLDCNSHGTHVAGIIAGYGEDTGGNKFTGDYTTLNGLSSSAYQALFRIGPGMAPRAKIISYKVFGCTGSTNVVGAALDAAASAHVDVVNMSLGSDFGSPQDGDSVLANADAALGISVVVAAGNGGDLYDVGGSPGNATRVIGVAASQDAYSQIDTLHATVNGTPHDYGAQRSVAYDWVNKPAGDLAGSVVEITDPNNKDGCDPISQDLTGKVVFLTWTDDDTVRRCGSAARSQNAEDAGAAGVIIGEDEEVFAAGITGSADIPVVQVVKSASDQIQAALDASQPVSASGTDASNLQQLVPANDDKVASFSSRGIRDAGDAKPDVTAVGSSVFSAGMGSGNEGLSDSGTSMATPMVAGLSALIRSENSGWNPEQVKADIMNTAGQDLFTGDTHSGDKYAPNRVGAGRIDAQAALGNQVLAYVTNDPGAVSASFGTIEATGPMTLHKTIELDNQSGNPETYDTSYQALTSVPGAVYTVSPSTVTVNAHSTNTVTLTLTINPVLLTKTIDPTVDQLQAGLPREFLADASGRVLFTPNPNPESVPTLRVPVYSAPRPASVMTQPGTLAMPSGSVQTASLPLSGTGVAQGAGAQSIQSIVAGFELQAKSGALPNCGGSVTTGCIHASDEKAADLKYVGSTSDSPELQSIGDDPLNPNCNPDGQCGLEYFAISTQGPWHTAASQNEYDIFIDTNGDGVPDTVTFNTRLSGTDIFVDETLDLNTLDVLDVELINDRFGDVDTALFDSDTLVMPVFIPALGVSAGHSRVNYGVITFGQFSPNPVDSVGFDSNLQNLTGSLSTDVLNPGLAVFGSFDGNEDPLLYADMPNTSLTVRRDAASYAADHGMGALLVHFHNKAGNKAQIVDVGHTLTVAKNGTGSGTVTSSPGGINCGTSCVGSFATGASVTLTATAAPGSAFTGWSGAGCSGTGSCHVTLNADTTVTATFIPKMTLTVSKAGNGSGTVTSSPSGINCGSTCSSAFPVGTSVTLTAAAGSGSKFGGWSGGGCSGTGTCHVTLNAATSVTATFTKKDTTKPKVTSVKVKVNHSKRTAKVKFRGTDPGNGSKGLRFKCKLDKKPFKSCRSPKLYKNLKHGKHTVQVKAIDRAGNVSKPVKRKFKV